MQLTLKDNLPFVTVVVTHKGQAIEITNVLVDTGSGSTILSADAMQVIQITPSPEDTLYIIRGIGGNEVVYSHRVENIRIGEGNISNFEIEIGGMDYGFEINGIIGMDYLVQTGAIINLQDTIIEFAG